MTTQQKSWAITGLFGVLFTALSAYLNLVPLKQYDGIPQPDIVANVHIAAALLGSCLFARFVQGSRKAMQGAVGRPVTSSVFIARVGEFRQTVSGKSAFFSTRRTLQLLGFFVCLMAQFAFVAAPPAVDGPDPVRAKIRTISA